MNTKELYKIIILSVLLLTLMSCASVKGHSIYNPRVSYRLVITSGLAENKYPIDKLDSIPIDLEKFIIFVQWFHIATTNHNCLWELYNNDGEIVHTSSYEFIPNQNSWNAWTTYYFKQALDKPGEWRFVVYLDGIKHIDSKIQVVAPGK